MRRRAALDPEVGSEEALANLWEALARECLKYLTHGRAERVCQKIRVHRRQPEGSVCGVSIAESEGLPVDFVHKGSGQ